MKKILYIEDETDHVLFMRLLLEAKDFELISAPDGKSGLKSVFENKPDLILLDLNIPLLSGFEVLKQIKANSETQNIPVVIISAFGDQDNIKKCQAAGARGFLTKPYEVSKLMKTIERAFK